MADDITLRASATSTNGTILGVAFYAGESLLGLVTDAPYELMWSNVLRGSYELRARAFDSAGAVSSSEPVDISVDPCYPAVDVVLVIDRSGSMGDPITKFDDARQASSNFVGRLIFPNDQAGVISFATDPSTDQTLVNNSNTILWALSQIPKPEYSGYTYMSNALRAARIELTSARHNTSALPVVVFLSVWPADRHHECGPGGGNGA